MGTATYAERAESSGEQVPVLIAGGGPGLV